MPKNKDSSIADLMLDAGVDTTASAKSSKKVSPSNRSSKSKEQSKEKLTGAYFPPEVLKQLKMIAIEEEKTLKEIVSEAYNLVFEQYGKNPIA